MGKQSRRRIRSAKVARAKPAALGFRAHSGWAAAVVVGGSPGSPVVLDRRRIELIDSTIPGQPYHAAAEMSFSEAERFIAQCIRRTHRLACQAVKSVVDELRERGHTIVGCGLLLGSGRLLTTLAATLASHTMIHTAEGELFRDALKHAAEKCGLPLVGVKEREAYTRAASELKVAERDLPARLNALGKQIGASLASGRKAGDDRRLASAGGMRGEVARLQRVMPNRCRAVLVR